MTAVARGAALGASTPLLSEYIASDGKLIEPFALSWSIYDVSTGAKEDTPSLVAGPTDVDVDADKVSTGQYAVTWTVPANEPLGRHRVIWTATLVEDGAVLTWSRDFEVVAAGVVAASPGYILVADMREEGVSEAQASSAVLRRKIAEASAYIEQFTGAWFEARRRSYKLDGTGSDVLLLPDPLIAVDTVALSGTLVAAASYKVYTAASSPVDRFAPRITRTSALQGTTLVPTYAWPASGYTLAPVWPRLRQNVAVEALTGWLEPDGSPAGGVPLLIKKACRMLVIRNLPKLADADAVLEAKNKHRVVSERTREQSYELARVGGAVGDGREAPFTGDPEIDVILEGFSRPPYIGFASA